jgi:exonuclease SbcC
MISITQLRDRVAAKFPQTKQLGETTLRFIRTSNEQPFAICYLDLNQELPSDELTLAAYLDRVVGADYFEGKKSLQWSNYVYFVTTAKRLGIEKIRQAKELIENDRRYARKFVITEQELDTVLSPPVIAPKRETEQPNVLSIWMQRLSESGLDAAVLSDEDIPKRLAKIEAKSEVSTRATLLSTSAQHGIPTFIRSLELTKFRRYPLQRQFQFGSVNLIVGPNASGKTSLLEAIELYYCGRNKRNPSRTVTYDLTIAFVDGAPEKAGSNRGPQVFRQRNLAWYGQPEVKTTNLYQSFAKFNFLDTDAAVDIADSTTHIEEDLSKLLVGPDASKIWDSIERLHVALTAKLRDLNDLKRQITEELFELTKRQSATAEVKRESDLVRERLKQMLQRVKWRSAGIDHDRKSAGELVSTLTELTAVAGQVSSFGWLTSPISLKSLAAYCSATNGIITKAQQAISKLEAIQKKHAAIESAIKQERQTLDLLAQAQRLLASGVMSRKTERDETERNIAKYAAQLAGIDVQGLTQSVNNYHDELSEVLTVERTRSAEQADALVKQLEKAKNDHNTFARLRERSFNLAQQLRQISADILKESSNSDRCPLCHTQFGPHELSEYIKQGTDVELEKTGQNLLSRVSEIESALRTARAKASLYEQLVRFCQAAGLSADTTVATAIAQLTNVKKSLDDSRARLVRIDAELKTLGAQGYSFAETQQIAQRLTTPGHPISELTNDAINQLVAAGNRRVRAESQKLQVTVEEIAASTEMLRELFPARVKDFRVALLELKEKLAVTEGVVTRLNDFVSTLPWPQTSPIAELLVNANAVRAVSAELQSILGREQQEAAAQTQAEKRRKHLQSQLDELKHRLKRLSAAHATFTSLKDEHPLQGAMESTLQRNRAAIEAIFARIHSPDEFSGLGSKFSTLKRKSGAGEATLREVSTGQRAAFALSIFLAQNSQLIGAPPVMLIDDPIAHVDDLNALSFLDYLREIAVRGQRQIFFATANDKIGALFERKFDFLGPDQFKKIELSRNP